MSFQVFYGLLTLPTHMSCPYFLTTSTVLVTSVYLVLKIEKLAVFYRVATALLVADSLYDTPLMNTAIPGEIPQLSLGTQQSPLFATVVKLCALVESGRDKTLLSHRLARGHTTNCNKRTAVIGAGNNRNSTAAAAAAAGAAAAAAKKISTRKTSWHLT